MLSNEGIENTIYTCEAIRGILRIDPNRESGPDVTTLLKFRHLLETGTFG